MPSQPTAVLADPHTQKSISPLPVITNANGSSRPLQGELSYVKIEPLAARLLAWKAIPGVDSKYKRTRLLTSVPCWLPRFRGVTQTLVRDNISHVLWSEVQTLLAKAAMEICFYSRYFLVPKKDGGLRPIINLRNLNRVHMRQPFKMLTLKQILAQIQGLFFFNRESERRLLSHPHRPPSHTILEICGLGWIENE